MKRTIYILAIISMSLNIKAQKVSKKELPAKNKRVIKKVDSLKKSFLDSPFDACDCSIIQNKTSVIGDVSPCPQNSPSKTKIIVTQNGSTLSWGNKKDYPATPRVYNLPKGKTYHVSVKSKFGLFWYSECGTDITIDNDVVGNISNTNRSFCQNEDMMISTSVSNERRFQIEFKKNNVTFYSNTYSRPLNSIENLKLLANNGNSEFNFQPGQYELIIIAINNVGQKVYSINFRVKHWRDCPFDVEFKKLDWKRNSNVIQN